MIRVLSPLFLLLPLVNTLSFLSKCSGFRPVQDVSSLSCPANVTVKLRDPIGPIVDTFVLSGSQVVYNGDVVGLIVGGASAIDVISSSELYFLRNGTLYHRLLAYDSDLPLLSNVDCMTFDRATGDLWWVKEGALCSYGGLVRYVSDCTEMDVYAGVVTILHGKSGTVTVDGRCIVDGVTGIHFMASHSCPLSSSLALLLLALFVRS